VGNREWGYMNGRGRAGLMNISVKGWFEGGSAKKVEYWERDYQTKLVGRRTVVTGQTMVGLRSGRGGKIFLPEGQGRENWGTYGGGVKGASMLSLKTGRFI